jgi:hypothetical protein
MVKKIVALYQRAFETVTLAEYLFCCERRCLTSLRRHSAGHRCHSFDYALVLGFLLSLMPTLLLAGPGPKIEFEEREHDFGDVVHGASPSIELNFTNAGEENLIVERISSSCGCAKGLRGDRNVAPGASSKIYAQIDTLGMPPGRHAKSVAVHSNDPENPVTTLRLKFNIVRNVCIEPGTLGTSLTEWGKDAVFTLTAANSGPEPVTVKGAKSDNSDEVTLVPQELVVPAGTKADFQLSVKAQLRDGAAYSRGTALIETTDEREKTIPIRYLIRFPQVSVR